MTPRPPTSTLFPYTTLFRSFFLAAMNAATMFAWWGLNLWVPSYLSLPSTQGGVGLPTETMAMFVVAMQVGIDRKSTRLNSSHGYISYAVFCLKKKKKTIYLV